MKSIFLNNIKSLFIFFITAIVFTGVGVYASSQYFARDISFTPNDTSFVKDNGEVVDNVEDAINALYSNIEKDEFENKDYSSDNLSVVSNRATILSGGYYTNNGFTYVNITIKVNSTFGGSAGGTWSLISNFPEPKDNRKIILEDTSYNYAFFLGAVQDNRADVLRFFNEEKFYLSAGTEVTLKFKYESM